MKDRCPKCEFAYAWDGTRCNHCKFVSTVRTVGVVASTGSAVLSLADRVQAAGMNPPSIPTQATIAATGMPVGTPETITDGLSVIMEGTMQTANAVPTQIIESASTEGGEVVEAVGEILGELLRGLFGG